MLAGWLPYLQIQVAALLEWWLPGWPSCLLILLTVLLADWLLGQLPGWLAALQTSLVVAQVAGWLAGYLFLVPTKRIVLHQKQICNIIVMVNTFLFYLQFFFTSQVSASFARVSHQLFQLYTSLNYAPPDGKTHILQVYITQKLCMGCLAHLHLSSFSLVACLEACTQLE